MFVRRTIRRGGYQPPAQHKLKSQEMLGEFAPVSHIYTIQPNTQVRYLAGDMVAAPTNGVCKNNNLPCELTYSFRA